MSHKYIIIGFYLMVIPLSILIFCDFQLLHNILYTVLHILLTFIYFITFYLVIKLNHDQPMQTEAEIQPIPSAPVMIV